LPEIRSVREPENKFSHAMRAIKYFARRSEKLKQKTEMKRFECSFLLA
jgi:hypothetical protein